MILSPQSAAIAIYISLLFLIGFWSHKKHQTATDFILGSRSLNFYTTALAAHASDMSSWLFMAFPAMIFLQGVINAWVGIGLIVFMLLNWILVAPKVRIQTEVYNSLTFSSFFESRFHDTSGLIRLFTAALCLIFYSVYISAGFVAIGTVDEILFNIPYHFGTTLGLFIVLPYLFIGGYLTLAWLDLFQGLFLIVVIALVPFIMLPQIGGMEGIATSLRAHFLSDSLLPNTSLATWLSIATLFFGWGIGYFGQPHIITKFMGIKDPSEIKKSACIGITWQTIAIGSATFIGLIGIAYFSHTGLSNPELVFIEMVRQAFPPFIMAFILCAVIAATISTIDSQILVLASSLTEDVYKRLFRKTASSKELLAISRLFVFLVSMLAYLVAFFKISTIYSLVSYAWSGLGASFGPLLIFSLWSKTINRYGAWAGLLIGGITVIIWPLINDSFSLSIFPLIPGFLFSSLAICIVSWLTRSKCHPMHLGDR